MRILQVADMYPPNLGGTEQHVQVLSRWLRAAGHEVEVATLARPDLPEHEVDEFGVAVHRIRGLCTLVHERSADPTSTYHPTFPDPVVRRNLEQLIDRFQPDVVHSHGWIAQSAGWVRRSDRRRFASVVTLHDHSYTCVRKVLSTQDGRVCPGPSKHNCRRCAVETYGQVLGRIHLGGLESTRSVMAGADLTIAVSNSVRVANELHVTAVGGPPIEVISSFIRAAVIDPARQRVALPAALPKKFALFAGVVTEAKGITQLFAAWQAISDRVDIDLVVVGPDRRTTPTAVPDRVHVLGARPNLELLSIMEKAQFVVCPSVCADAFPTVVVESLALGRPVIGSRVGGIVDQIQHNRNGLLVTPGDVGELEAAMLLLATDAELRACFSAEGPQRGNQFTVDAVAPRLLAAFERLTGARAPEELREASRILQTANGSR